MATSNEVYNNRERNAIVHGKRLVGYTIEQAINTLNAQLNGPQQAEAYMNIHVLLDFYRINPFNSSEKFRSQEDLIRETCTKSGNPI